MGNDHARLEVGQKLLADRTFERVQDFVLFRVDCRHRGCFAGLRGKNHIFVFDHEASIPIECHSESVLSELG